jgi:hypothetical protein
MGICRAGDLFGGNENVLPLVARMDYNPADIPKITDWHALDGSTVWNVNYISNKTNRNSVMCSEEPLARTCDFCSPRRSLSTVSG